MNLVIGTLYCAKGNFEFGVTRVIKSLEPYDRKLSTDTWHYAKRCLLALAETLAKLGMPCFGCTPDRLPELLAGVLRGTELKTLASRVSEGK